VLIAIIVVVAVLAALAATLPLLDRRVAALAERLAAQHLSAPFGYPATVRVHGTPFLTQALRGRYRDVEVLGGLRLGEIEGATLVAHLTNAYLPLRALLGRRATELPCERVSGRLVLPYAELARLARIPGLTLAFEGERLTASAALPVPGISQLARVNGEAVLSLVEGGAGGTVWLRLRGVTLAGINLPALVLTQLLPALTVPIPVPPLPYGLRIDEVRATASGLVVDGSAEAVVFRRPGPATAAVGAG
jgi:LmeA-like phospholipid-binding